MRYISLLALMGLFTKNYNNSKIKTMKKIDY